MFASLLNSLNSIFVSVLVTGSYLNVSLLAYILFVAVVFLLFVLLLVFSIKDVIYCL